jgi:hypothetical protein
VVRPLIASGAAVVTALIGPVDVSAQSPSVQAGSSPTIKRLCLIKAGVNFEMQPGYVAPLAAPLQILTCKQQQAKPLRLHRATRLSIFLKVPAENLTATWFEGESSMALTLLHLPSAFPPAQSLGDPPPASSPDRWQLTLPRTSGRLILSVFDVARTIPGGLERSRFDWKLSVRRH